MKNIRLVVGKVYIAGGTKYEADKTYTVKDAVGKKLLTSEDSRNIPYFRLWTDEDEAVMEDQTVADQSEADQLIADGATDVEEDPTGTDESVEV